MRDHISQYIMIAFVICKKPQKGYFVTVINKATCIPGHFIQISLCLC